MKPTAPRYPPRADRPHVYRRDGQWRVTCFDAHRQRRKYEGSLAYAAYMNFMGGIAI